MLWAILVFHVSARCQIGAVPPKARTPRRAEFLAQPTTPYCATPTIYTGSSISFKTNQSHKQPLFRFCAQENAQKRPSSSSFEVHQIRRQSRTRQCVRMHFTPESLALHEPNVLSQHTNPQKSYVHGASLSPSGPTPARPHLDILPSRLFLGACLIRGSAAARP